MDFSIASRKVEPIQERSKVEGETSTATNTVTSSSTDVYNYCGSLSSLPSEGCQTYDTETPPDLTLAEHYHLSDYSAAYYPPIYSPYYGHYLENYIFYQPLIPLESLPLPINHPSPALFTPPPTPHTGDQDMQCCPTTHTHIPIYPRSPVAEVHTVAATAATIILGEAVQGQNPIITETEKVSRDTSNRGWKDRFVKGYGEPVTGAAPL